jgi:hypothetical protein
VPAPIPCSAKTTVTYSSFIRPILKIAQNGDEIDIQYELPQPPAQASSLANASLNPYGLTLRCPAVGLLCNLHAPSIRRCQGYTKISPGMMKSMRRSTCRLHHSLFHPFPSNSAYNSAILLRWHDHRPIVSRQAFPTRSRTSSAYAAVHSTPMAGS